MGANASRLIGSICGKFTSLCPRKWRAAASTSIHAIGSRTAALMCEIAACIPFVVHALNAHVTIAQV